MSTQLYVNFHGRSIPVPVAPDNTIRQLKEHLSPVVGLPVANLRLVRGGTELLDEHRVRDYAFQLDSTIHLIRTNTQTAPAPPQPEPPAAAVVQWRRPAYQELPRVDHALPEIRGSLEAAEFFVWCTAQEHQPCQIDSDGTPYASELQPASARPRCALCKSASVLAAEGVPATAWPAIFSQTVPGECFTCQQPNVTLEYTFVCQGVLVTPVTLADGRQLQVCKSESTQLQNVVLPNVVRNHENQESIDTLGADAVQVRFHPCQHAMNANGVAAYVREVRRASVVENTQLPEVFGRYVLRCPTPTCAGILYVPTCKLAGSQLHETIKNWGAVETVLAAGGIQCPMESHPGLPAFIPRPDEPGPQVYCNSCQMAICEEHALPWNACEHTRVDPVHRVRERILEQLRIGMWNTCPRCGLMGQKDSACTHISCQCGVRWCYFCGLAEEDADKGAPLSVQCEPIWRHNIAPENNRRRCVLYLHQHPLLAGDGVTALAKYHYLKVLRLLRNLRAEVEPEHPGVFDAVFLALPSEMRTVEVTLEGAPAVRMEPLTLEDIHRPPLNVPYALP